MARRKKSGSGVAVGVGLALAAAAVVGVAAIKSKSAQAATPPPPPLPSAVPAVTPPNPTAMTLQAGHRYSVAQLAPIPGAPVGTVNQAQAMFDALMPGVIRVVSVGGQPTTLVLDVLKSVPFTVPSTMPVTDLGPSPASPAPTAQQFTAVITDPNAVRQYQTMLASALAQPVSPIEGLTAADYGPADVDGDPANARWVRALSVFQTMINPALPAAFAAGKLPAGYPAQLRTDGALDYATAIAMQNA